MGRQMKKVQNPIQPSVWNEFCLDGHSAPMNHSCHDRVVASTMVGTRGRRDEFSGLLLQLLDAPCARFSLAGRVHLLPAAAVGWEERDGGEAPACALLSTIQQQPAASRHPTPRMVGDSRSRPKTRPRRGDSSSLKCLGFSLICCQHGGWSCEHPDGDPLFGQHVAMLRWCTLVTMCRGGCFKEEAHGSTRGGGASRWPPARRRGGRPRRPAAGRRPERAAR